MLPRYDITRSYDWNYANAPAEPPEVEVPPYPGSWDFLGIPVNSPLGIPAGPLLNRNFIPARPSSNKRQNMTGNNCAAVRFL